VMQGGESQDPFTTTRPEPGEGIPVETGSATGETAETPPA
jgi:hypothetical protein